MKQQSASIILQAMEVGSDGRWMAVKAALLEAGYTPREIVAAGQELGDEAGCDNPFCMADFR